MLYTTNFFIIKNRSLNDKDMILTVLSDNRGRFDVVVKSVKSSRSHKSTKLDLLNNIKGTFAEGKNLDILTECKLLNSFSKLKNDPSKNFFIWILLELVEKVSFINPENTKDIYHKIFEYIDFLMKVESKDELSLCVSSLMLFLLKDSGFEANFETFLDSGEDITEGKQIYLSNDLGFNETNGLYLVGEREFKVIKLLSNSDLETCSKINLKEVKINLVTNITRIWYEICVGTKLKSYSIFFK